MYSTLHHKIISEKGGAFQRPLESRVGALVGKGSPDILDATVRAAQSLSGLFKIWDGGVHF